MTLGSFGKALGPTVGSVLFAWTLSNSLPPPFDFHFVFILCALLSSTATCISLALPKSMDRPYDAHRSGS